MSIDFMDLTRLTGLDGLPELFYAEYSIRAMINGSQVCYDVVPKNSNAGKGVAMNLAELKNFAVRSVALKCERELKPFLPKEEKPPNKKEGDLAARLRDFLKASYKRDATAIEMDFWVFLLKELTYLRGSEGKSRFEFVEERLKNQAFMESGPNILQFFYPNRIESWFTISEQETELFAELPKSVQDENQDLKTGKWEGKTELLPFRPPFLFGGEKEKDRQAVGLRLRKKNPKNFLKRMQRFVLWKNRKLRNEQEVFSHPDLERKWKRIPFIDMVSDHGLARQPPKIEKKPSPSDEEDLAIVAPVVRAAFEHAELVVKEKAFYDAGFRRVPLLRHIFSILEDFRSPAYVRTRLRMAKIAYLVNQKLTSALARCFRKKPGLLGMAYQATPNTVQ